MRICWRGCLSSILEKFDFWQLVTLAWLISTVVIFLTVVVAILTLPGSMAIARKHPDAEAVRTMGVLDFRAVVPRLQAFIWALEPTDKVDIRRLPREERAFTEREIAWLCLRSA